MLAEIENGVAVFETVWQYLKRLNTELPYDPTIPLVGINPREIKTQAHTNT